MKTARIFRLEAGANEGVKRFLGDRVDARSLAEGRKTTVVTVTRTGRFFDPRYGEFEITRQMLLSMVSNFESGVYGQKIVLDLAHKPQDGAAGFFKRLFLDGNKLRGEVELTDYGVEAIQKKGFIYLSAEFADNYEDNEQRQKHGPTLLGAALTPRPVIKRLDPVQLSEAALDGAPTYLSERVQRFLQEDLTMTLKEMMQALQKKLSEFNLAEAIITQLISSFEVVGSKLANEQMQATLMSEFVTQGGVIAKQMADAGEGDQTIKLDFTGLNEAVAKMGSGASGLSEDDVKRLLAEQTQQQAEDTRKLAEQRETRVSQFNQLLEDAEGLKSLPEASRKTLAEAAELITPDMTEDQVIKLAEHQIKLGNDMVVHSKLSGMGYHVNGSPHIAVGDSNDIKALQETIDRRLGLLDMPDSRRFKNTGGTLQAENKKFAEKVLAQMDIDRGAQLHSEHKMLAGGDGVVSDVAIPAIFERTVIREALYRLVGLQFVNVGTEQFAASAIIPYSYRDTAAAGRDNTRVYEGGSIPRAGVIQTSETAYPIPQKISFEVSDELRHLTGSGVLNWDAVSENTANASRIINEDTEQMIFNETLRASDEFGATAVVAEDIGARTNAVLQTFILANFPVVRPRSISDLQGNQVGVTVNPVTVTYNTVAIAEYDGTGNQAAGTYYSLDYNLGEITLVNEAGVVQTPAGADTLTVSYSYATNVSAFNSDEGAVETSVYWDNFLYRYGLRKAVIEDDRYHMADFGAMSGTVLNQIEQARKFAANYRVPATELDTNGNVGRIKDVPNFKTSAPGLWMGDQRVIIGERGITRLRMMKPWAMGQMENQKDANGRFTGKKEAYGDQFLVLHTPTQLKRAYTSMVLYSATARVDR